MIELVMEWQPILTGVSVTVGGGIVLYVSGTMHKRFKTFMARVTHTMESVEKMERNSAKRIDETRIIFKALRSIIDAQQTGVANGNVKEAKQELDDYLTNAIGG
jgi:ribosomal protein L6P/L9E